MQHEAGEHHGGVSGTLLYGTLRSGELGGPGLVWGVCQLLVWEERIVVIDVAIGISYLITEVFGVDVGWFVQLMQTDGELLGVSDETDGMVGNLKILHLYRFVAQSLPEGIKRKSLVFYLSGISVESGTEFLMLSPAAGASMWNLAPACDSASSYFFWKAKVAKRYLPGCKSMRMA